MKIKLFVGLLAAVLLFSCFYSPNEEPDDSFDLSYSILDSHSVKVDWPRWYGSRGYVLEKRAEQGEFNTLALLKDVSTYTDRGLELDVNYYYRLYVIGNDSIGDYSNVLKVCISKDDFVVLEIAASVTEDNFIELSWHADYSSVSSYAVERKENDTGYELLSIIDGSDTTFIDTTISPFVNYTYRIYAVIDGKVMNYSNEVSEIVNSDLTVEDVIMNMVYVQGDTFQMGDLWDLGIEDELPVHNVYVNGFYMGVFEVTQEQYVTVMHANPSYYSYRPNHPAENMRFLDMIEFCNKLSIAHGYDPAYILDTSYYSITLTWDTTKNGYRLPTEAEWEYAARGGGRNDRIWSGTDIEENIVNYAWYNDPEDETHAVGGKLSNDLGLYDMSGNVWERCWDLYDSDYYSYSPINNPKGINSGSNRSNRGGSFGNTSADIRNTNRNAGLETTYNRWNGFRVCRNAE